MLCNAHWCLLLPGSNTFEQMTAWLIPSIPLFLCIDLSQCKQSMEAILSFLPQLATESISIIPPIDSLQCLSRGSAVSVIEWGFFFFLPLSPWHEYPHTYTHSHSRSLSARCCQGYRAAGEAAGDGWRPRSQAPVSEEGPSEWVLHSHQRGESLSREGTAGPWTPTWLMSFHSFFFLWDSFYFYFLMTFLLPALLAVVFFALLFQSLIVLGTGVFIPWRCCSSSCCSFPCSVAVVVLSSSRPWYFFCLSQTNRESRSHHFLWRNEQHGREILHNGRFLSDKLGCTWT